MKKNSIIAFFSFLFYEIIIFIFWELFSINILLPYNALLKEILICLGILFYLIYLVIACGLGFVFKKKIKYKELLWTIPLFAVAFANFPLFALISKEAVIIYPWGIILFVFNTLLTATIEEIIFRLLLNYFLANNFKIKSFLLKLFIMSFLFSLTHLLNGLDGILYQMSYTFLIGMMLGYLYLKTKNIILPIVIHFIYNFGGLFVLTLGDGNYQNRIYWLILIPVSIFCFLYLLVDYLKRGDIDVD